MLVAGVQQEVFVAFGTAPKQRPREDTAHNAGDLDKEGDGREALDQLKDEPRLRPVPGDQLEEALRLSRVHHAF